MDQYPTISIVIPAYNEAKRIGHFLSSITDYFKKRKIVYEVIVVSDGSVDSTEEVVNTFSKLNPNIRSLSYAENRGKGYAVNFGMREAKGDYRLFADADGSVGIEYLDSFLSYLKEGNDIVIGSIELLGTKVVEENRFYRRILGSLSKILIRFVATPGIYDTQRGFKLFSRQAARDIFSRQTITGFGFDIELLVIARALGYRVKEVPVVWINPKGSTVGLFSYVTTLWELARIIYSLIRGRYREGEYTFSYRVEQR